MDVSKSALLRTLVFLIIGIFIPTDLYAYLDPGAGSYLIQVAIAAILGGLYSIKLFWKNIKSFWTKLFNKKVKH